jgi:hypothetical protein
MITHTGTLHRRSRRLLEELGIIDPVRAKVRAFDQLHIKLLAMKGIQAVAVQGFAKSSMTVNSDSGGEVTVILAKNPDAELQRHIENVFFEINRRYGTTMVPVIFCRDTLNPE